MSEPESNFQAQSGITGRVIISPTHGGPIRAGESDAAPMAAAEFVVRNGEKIVAAFVTDEQGRFRVVLPPGNYAVATKRGKPGFGGCGPFAVTVVAGKFHEVQWDCESGLR